MLFFSSEKIKLKTSLMKEIPRSMSRNRNSSWPNGTPTVGRR
jgi:hypothetical protein